MGAQTLVNCLFAWELGVQLDYKLCVGQSSTTNSNIQLKVEANKLPITNYRQGL